MKDIYQKALIGIFCFLFSNLAAQERPLIILTPENPLSKTPVIEVNADSVLQSLRPEHPRIWLTKDKMARIKQQVKTDPLLASYVDNLLKEAEELLGKPVERTPELNIKKEFREILNRELVLGFAYHFTGDHKYSEPVIKDLLYLCDKKDWEWIHFLDPAEGAITVGLGYDWFYDSMDEPTRSYIRKRLITNGLIPGIAAYAGAPYGWFRFVRHNWNQVCNTGMIIGALAIAETDPEYAKILIPQAVSSLPVALNEYAPDGAYPEGPTYWKFATNFTIQGFEALRTALGTDFGLSKLKGFDQTFYYSLYCFGPSGIQFGYADQGPLTKRTSNGMFFWMANRFNDPYLADNEHAYLKEHNKKAGIFHVLFYAPSSGKATTNIPLDRYFNGPVPAATMRGSWSDQNTAFVGVKGGYNQVNHGHLDLGNFELDMLGERWFYDIGSDNYRLNGYFDMDSLRWTYYRNISESHNVPLIDQEGQDIKATAKFTEVSLNTKNPFVKVDLTEAYKKTCTKATRGISLVNNREFVLIQDEFELKGKHKITWGGTTKADILVKGKEAILSQNGKQIKVVLISPANAVFKAGNAPSLSSVEKSTEGIKRLIIDVPGASGKQKIVVMVVPGNTRSKNLASYNTSLSMWNPAASE